MVTKDLSKSIKKKHEDRIRLLLETMSKIDFITSIKHNGKGIFVRKILKWISYPN